MRKRSGYENPEIDYRILNVGAEGEVAGVVQQNLGWVVCDGGKDFTCSRNGQKIGLEGLKQSGPLVVSSATDLPFKNGAFEKIIANNVPIDTTDTHLGATYRMNELIRICCNGESGVVVNGKKIKKRRGKGRATLAL